MIPRRGWSSIVRRFSRRNSLRMSTMRSRWKKRRKRRGSSISMKTAADKKTALLTVFFVVMIDLMGFGIVLPLLPFYASRFGVSAVMIGLLYSVYSFSQLVFSPFWGGLSDRIGRRPVMLVSTLGASLAYVLFGFAHTFAILFLSRLLAG